MKNLIIILTILLSINTVFSQNRDKLITKEELPKESIEFLNTYFSDTKENIIRVDYDIWIEDYQVFLDNVEIEFYKSGKLKEIKCRNGVDYKILPKEIIKDLLSRYKNPIIKEFQIEIESKRRVYYEVTLKGGLELTYNKRFKLIDIDY